MGLAGFNTIRKKQADLQQIEIKDDIEEFENKNIEEMTFPELKKYAKEKGINSYKMSKEELVAALEKVGD